MQLAAISPKSPNDVGREKLEIILRPLRRQAGRQRPGVEQPADVGAKRLVEMLVGNCAKRADLVPAFAASASMCSA